MKENLSEVLIEKIKFESLKNELEIILLNKENEETNINLEFNSSLDEKQEKINFLNEELKKSREDLGSADSSILSLENQLKVISEEKFSFEKQKNNLEETIKEKENSRDEEIKSTMAEKEKEISIIQEKLKCAISTCQSSDSRLLILEDDIKQLHLERNKSQLEIEKLMYSNSESNERFQNEKNSLLSENESRINFISEELQNAVKELGSANSKILSQKQKCFEIEKEKNNLLSELSKLRKEFDANRLDIGQSEEELKKLLSENEMKIATLKESHSVRLSDVESEMTHCRVEREHLRKRVRTYLYLIVLVFLFFIFLLCPFNCCALLNYPLAEKREIEINLIIFHCMIFMSVIIFIEHNSTFYVYVFIFIFIFIVFRF